jgi:hypothetical protein
VEYRKPEVVALVNATMAIEGIKPGQVADNNHPTTPPKSAGLPLGRVTTCPGGVFQRRTPGHSSAVYKAAGGVGHSQRAPHQFSARRPQRALPVADNSPIPIWKEVR